jgi:hypothetical protein
LLIESAKIAAVELPLKANTGPFPSGELEGGRACCGNQNEKPSLAGRSYWPGSPVSLPLEKTRAWEENLLLQ